VSWMGARQNFFRRVSRTEVTSLLLSNPTAQVIARRYFPNRGPLTPAFSAYLDFIRFAAALGVFFCHFSWPAFTGGAVPQVLGAYGIVAVTIFFVLSGYVIAYVSSNRESNAPAWFASRISRLYSVVLIALPLTFFLDRTGSYLRPDFYRLHDVLMKPESWQGYLSSLFFVNEYRVFRFDGIVPGTNVPYWSLSFEATYYVLAGMALFARRKLWLALAVVILIAAGRTITALLPVWVLGFLLYRTTAAKNLSTPMSLFLFVLTAALVLISPFLDARIPFQNFGVWMPWGRGQVNRNLFLDYGVAVTFSINLLCARNLLASVQIRDRSRAVVRWLGSLTFPLYCIHFPVLCFLAAISPCARSSAANLIFIGGCTFALVVVATPACDALKEIIRARVQPLLARETDADIRRESVLSSGSQD
jgi:peptidoglycan/LPS O-acetylase OafA/YrhL